MTIYGLMQGYLDVDVMKVEVNKALLKVLDSYISAVEMREEENAPHEVAKILAQAKTMLDVHLRLLEKMEEFSRK